MYLRFYYTDTRIFDLFNEMLTDNMGFWLRLKETRYSCFAAVMVTVTAALVAHSAIPLVGCDLFAAKRVARLLWTGPSRSACQSQQPAASGRRPAMADLSSQPASQHQPGSEPVITSYNYHTIILKC